MDFRSEATGFRRTAIGVACALLLVAGAARAECPEGSFRFPQGTPLESLNASAWDTTITQPFTVAHAGYDLAAGTARFDVDSAPAAILFLLLRDTFTIEGPPPGTLCGVRAELHFTGSLLAYGGHGTAAYASAALRVGAAPEASAFVPDNGPGNLTPFDRVLAVDLEVPAGTPFSLDCEFAGGANIGGDAKANAHATLAVTTTNPSGRPVSCHGYGQAAPVEARSWGALKVRYR